MSVIGYGDNYGDRYGEAYTDETVQITASGSFVLTGPLIVDESGVIATTAEFNKSDVGGYGDNYGANYGGGEGEIEIAYADESGTITSDAFVLGTEQIPTFESSSLSANVTPAIADKTGALESGAIESAITNAIVEAGEAVESGVIGATAQPSLTDKSLLSESGSISATGQFRFTPFVITDSDDPVEAFKAILSETRSQAYSLPRPDVFAMWELDPQQRLKNPDPAVYIWSPTPGSLDRFSADGDLTTDERNVELMVMTYDAAHTHRYTESIVDIIGDYVDDNADLTVYEDVDVDTVADERGDHIFGESNHYINTIEISTSRLRRTDVI